MPPASSPAPTRTINLRAEASPVPLPLEPPAWAPPLPEDPRGRHVSWAVVIWEGPLTYWDLWEEAWLQQEIDLAWIEGQVAAYEALLAECPDDPHPILRRHNSQSGEREGCVLRLAAAWDPEREAHCLLAALAWADPDAAEKIALGKIRNVSVGLGGLVTNSGTVYEEIVMEISIVAAGHIRGARVLNTRGNNVKPKNTNAPPAETPAQTPPTQTPPTEAPAAAAVDPAAIKAAVAAALAELLPSMIQQVMAAEDAAEGMEGEMACTPGEEKKPSAEMAALQRQIAALQQEALSAKKAAFDAAYPQGAVIDLGADGVREVLRDLHLSNPEAFAKLEAAAKKTDPKSAPAAAPARSPFARLASTDGSAPGAGAPGKAKLTASSLNAAALTEAGGDAKKARALFREKIAAAVQAGDTIDYTA